jgi:hypothetical protein
VKNGEGLEEGKDRRDEVVTEVKIVVWLQVETVGGVNGVDEGGDYIKKSPSCGFLGAAEQGEPSGAAEGLNLGSEEWGPVVDKVMGEGPGVLAAAVERLHGEGEVIPPLLHV